MTASRIGSRWQLDSGTCNGAPSTLLIVFRAGPETFRTGWFVESLLTELVVALVMRTQRPFFRSRPGTLLLASTLVLIVIAFAIPSLPFADVFRFVRWHEDGVTYWEQVATGLWDV